jgi:hypothetical protein
MHSFFFKLKKVPKFDEITDIFSELKPGVANLWPKLESRIGYFSTFGCIFSGFCNHAAQKANFQVAAQRPIWVERSQLLWSNLSTLKLKFQPENLKDPSKDPILQS